MLLKQQITREQALEISQRRREIEVKVRDLEDEYEKQRKVVASCGQVLLSAHTKKQGETRGDKERKRLKDIDDLVVAASRELADFNLVNPSERQLFELERLRVFRIQEKERERNRQCQQQQQQQQQ